MDVASNILYVISLNAFRVCFDILGLSMDVASNILYWISLNAFHVCFDIVGLSVDVASNILYWISLKKKTVNMYDLTNSRIKETPVLNMTSVMSMTMYGESIYLANSDNIIKINQKTQELKMIRDKTPHVYAMQVYDPSSRVNGQLSHLCVSTETTLNINFFKLKYIRYLMFHCGPIELFLVPASAPQLV